MKRLVSMLLFATIVLSLSMTGASASALSLEEINEKYGALIEAVEAGNSDAAIDELFRLLPPLEESEAAEDEVESEAIELSPENFLDYYELVLSESYCERDSAGKIKSVSPGGYLFKLKEEFQDRYDWGKNEEITLGVKGKAYFHRARIDWETGEIKVSDEANSDVRKAMKKAGYYTLSLDTQVTGYDTIWACGSSLYHKEKIYGHTYWTGFDAEPGNDYKYYQEVWKIDVVNVDGTLYLTPAA